MLKPAGLVLLFCLLGRFDCKDLTVKRGGNATLECFGSKNATQAMIEWKKSDLHTAVNVIVFKDGQFQGDIQDDSFKGRVKPKDPNWKETKDFTVNLTYVIMNDTGRYECKAGISRENIEVLNNTSLTVESHHDNITAVSGEKVTLACQNPNNDLIITVRWNRPDLEPKYVVLYQERGFDPKDQHPSFKDRVDLQNRQMKDGDVSLILKDVKTADAGTYECRVVWNTTNHMKRFDLEADPICIINLSLAPSQTGGGTKDGGKEDGGKEDGRKEGGSFELKVGLPVAAVLFVVVVVVVVVVVYLCRRRRRRQHRQRRHDGEGERREEHELQHLNQ